MKKKHKDHIEIEYDETFEKNNNQNILIKTKNLKDVAIIPNINLDNCAICTQNLLEKTKIKLENNQEIQLNYTILEGHRFAIKEINKDEPLLSWGIPFGFAICKIKPGDYVCNQSVLESLKLRNLDFELPKEPNFEDRLVSYKIDKFKPGKQVQKYEKSINFKGFQRSKNRGVGIRNYIVIIGLTSFTGSFTRILEQKLKKIINISNFENIDDIVSVSHTEGGTFDDNINNMELLLRTLSGFIIHPNIGATLLVDVDIKNDSQIKSIKDYLLEYLKKYNYPLEEVIHHFLSLTGNFENDLQNGISIIEKWLPIVNKFQRIDCPLSCLNVALQCGGSDAFSGISGNPLAAWSAKEIIKNGGSANLAETDELMGAESYILQNVKNIETAQKFLETIENFKKWASWHGHSAEMNPSAGNKLRGLYNIALKSLGAANKKDPEVQLDYVIDYGERMIEKGYYFMNSPGNDLESIAGQVASGCQLIYFITGNGSITNFPFVPTIKIITTTNRFKLLEKDMDINAGQYLDGISLDTLGKSLFELTLSVCSGTRTCGEKAGHSQVSIWRNWSQKDSSHLQELKNKPNLLSGIPLTISNKINFYDKKYRAIKNLEGKYTIREIGLILPTSLCSSQIAKQIADKLNIEFNTQLKFVSLPHTEGCGASDGKDETSIYLRTIIGHLIHPFTKFALLLEHGCEKTHNGVIQQELINKNMDISKFGWASVQLDGGIEKVTEKIKLWFINQLKKNQNIVEQEVELNNLKIALITPYNSKLSLGTMIYNFINFLESIKCLIKLIQIWVGCGGTIIIPQNSSLLNDNLFLNEIFGESSKMNKISPTLTYAQIPMKNGFHIMETPTNNWSECLTGLGATGVELMIFFTESLKIIGSFPSHPMIPLIQIIVSNQNSDNQNLKDFDLILQKQNNPDQWYIEIIEIIIKVASRKYNPKLILNNDFQITRGILGISM